MDLPVSLYPQRQQCSEESQPNDTAHVTLVSTSCNGDDAATADLLHSQSSRYHNTSTQPRTVNNNNNNKGRTSHRCNGSSREDKDDDDDDNDDDDDDDGSPLLYKLTDTPSPLLCVFFALQQGLLAIATPLTTVFIVSHVICAGNDDDVKTRILSATFFMMGLSTFSMATFGVRLPVFQGPNFTYVLPILGMLSLEEFKCPAILEITDPLTNVTRKMARISSDNVTIPYSDVIFGRMNELAGSLMVVGTIHCLIGVTGLVGFLANFIGPITIVPIIMLFGFQIHEVVAMFSESQWGIAFLTSFIAIILSLYLAKYKTPIPLWSSSKGFYISWQPFHTVFAIFISIIIGWVLCLILTKLNILSDNPDTKEYLSRTDARFQIVQDIDWFLFPYPGQFGVPRFNITTAITFFIATLMSIVDSIGDYSATARIAYAPPPPKFALNRGIATEGLMIFLGGAFGCGHGTVSFGENIGAMKLTRVVSRRVFQAIGIMYIFFAFVGKIGAFFITIPHAVMGGTQLVTFGLLIGVTLSYLEKVDLGSTRNLSILGISLLTGTMLPAWTRVNGGAFQTGANVQGDTVLKALLTNPSLVGGFLACLLDNTVPGSRQERGISDDHLKLDTQNSSININDGRVGHFKSGHSGSMNSREQGWDDEEIIASNDDIDINESELVREDRGLLHGTEVYRLPWLPRRIRESCIIRYLPIFDNKTQ